MYKRFPGRFLLFLMILPILPLLIVGCGNEKASSTVEPPGPLGWAVQSHLLLAKDAVAAIVNRTTGEPTSIPDFDLLFEAAARIDTSQTPAKVVATILALLGRASDFDCEVPDANYSLQFPNDHHLHPTMGFEWYYASFYLDATDPNGAQGRIAVIVSMQKQRVIGLSTQQQLGWSDNDSMLFVNLVTATVDFPEHKSITRRSENLQWPAAGGSALYSAPGELLYFECGSDSLSGTENVLPLAVSIQDGENISFSLTLRPPDGFAPENAFFLQGLPDSQFVEGTGLTSYPVPGIYYSWPQVVVDTSMPSAITIGGIPYTINSGKGWIDHQVMMQSLKNPGDAVSPIPFTDDPAPINGWCWQFFNLDNADAFTGASFQHWFLSTNPIFAYGYYVSPNTVLGTWDSIFIAGEMFLEDFRAFPVIVDDPSSSTVLFPNSWRYANVQSILGDPLEGTATPWFTDGTFNGQALQVISENPVDYKDTSGNHPDGVGFCESVGFERTDSYRMRALDFLNR